MKRILYGDDKPEMREKIEIDLGSRNLEIDLAEFPSEMIAKARSGNYHAIITDLEYTDGGREGYEVLRELRNYSGLKVLFSGVCGFEYVAEALESGADSVVLRKDSSTLIKLLDEKLNSGGENDN